MESIEERLGHLPDGLDDYADYLNEIMDSGEVENMEGFFQVSFRLFERNPSSSFGIPGPLVHKIEKYFPMYIGELIRSVERRATGHTLWMINRILNGRIENKMREELKSLLGKIALDQSIEEVVRKEAKSFLELQDT